MHLITQIVMTISLLCAAVVMHELGHYHRAISKGYDARIRWQKHKQRMLPDLVTSWSAKDDKDTNTILLSGVLAGTLPLLALTAGMNHISSLLIAWAWFAYFWLSRSDLKRIRLDYDL